MLAFLVPPYPRSVIVAPLLWCAIGAQAAFLLDVVPDLSLLAAGALAVVLLAAAKRSPGAGDDVAQKRHTMPAEK